MDEQLAIVLKRVIDSRDCYTAVQEWQKVALFLELYGRSAQAAAYRQELFNIFILSTAFHPGSMGEAIYRTLVQHAGQRLIRLSEHGVKVPGIEQIVRI